MEGPAEGSTQQGNSPPQTPQAQTSTPAQNPPLSSTEEDPARSIESMITAAERLKDDKSLPEAERAATAQEIEKTRAALERYRAVRSQKPAHGKALAAIGVASAGLLADDVTVIGVVDDPLLVGMALAAAGVAITGAVAKISHRNELERAWNDLGVQLEVLGQTIAMTAKGNVIHDYIVQEARRRIIEKAALAGKNLTASQITTEMLCNELKLLQDEFIKAGDSKKWRDTVSTQKGYECRPSRRSKG